MMIYLFIIVKIIFNMGYNYNLTIIEKKLILIIQIIKSISTKKKDYECEKK